MLEELMIAAGEIEAMHCVGYRSGNAIWVYVL
jgi:hypothetical protein